MLSALLDALCVALPRLSDGPVLTTPTLLMQVMHLCNIRSLSSALIFACFSHRCASPVERATTSTVPSARISADRNARDALACMGNCSCAQCRLRKRKSVSDLATRVGARWSEPKIAVKIKL